MKETIALAVPAVSLFIYILLSSIEFGSSLFSVFPALLSEENTIKDYMNPLWETTSIFLVFSLISLLAFFPGATLVWTSGLFSLLFAFLACMGARVVCILLTQYSTVQSLFVRMLYFTACFASALLGFLICMYFLLGTWYLPTILFSWTALLALSSILFAGSSFFRAYKKNAKLTGLARLSGTLFFASVTFFLEAVFKAYPSFSVQPLVTIFLPCILIMCITGTIFAEAREKYLSTFILFAISMAALFLAFFAAHLPYIVYPSVTIAASATNSASFNVLTASFGIGIIFVIPALILLYKLFLLSA